MNNWIPAYLRDAVCITILTLLSVLAWLPRLTGPIDLRYDAGVYYILGTSLAEGKGYRLLNEPGTIEAVQYPPLLPLFVAACQIVAGSSDTAQVGQMLRLSYFIFFVASIVGIYFLSRRYFSPGWAFLATLVMLLQVNSLWYSELLFAELPFIVLSVFFLLAAGRKERPITWLAAALAIACFLLRTSGIAVLAAWMVESLLKRRFREFLLRGIFAAIPVLAWSGYIQTVKGGEEYAHPKYEYQRAPYQFYNVTYADNLRYKDPFIPELGTHSNLTWFKRIVSNALKMPLHLGTAISVNPVWATVRMERLKDLSGAGWVPTWVGDRFPFWLMGLLILAGAALLAYQGEFLIPLVLIFSLGVICLTPWPPQLGRYVWPLTPLLTISVFTLLVWIREQATLSRHSWTRAGLRSFVTLVILGCLVPAAMALRLPYKAAGRTSYKTATGERRPHKFFLYAEDWRQFDEAVDWLDENVKTGGVVATIAPHWVYLKTGLKSVMPPFEPRADEAQRLLDTVPVRYLVLDGLEFIDISRRYAKPAVVEFPELWERVFVSSQGKSVIYRRRSGNGQDGAR